MPVHKLGWRDRHLNTRTQPRTIRWRPRMEVEFPPVKLTPTRWQIYCQEQMVIKPKQIKTISLGFGIEMSAGTTLVSIQPDLRDRSCVILDGTLIDSVSDVIFSIINNSKNQVAILPGQKMCCLSYAI